MNILFLNPPYRPRFSREQRSPQVTKSGTFYYPMWLAYACGTAQKAGHKCLLLDAVADGLTAEDIVNKIRPESPQLIVVICSTPSIYNDVKVTEQLKRAFPESKTVLVGTHVSALPKESVELSEAVDAAAKGEYELIVRELADAIDKGKSWDHIRGLTFRRGKEIISNPGMQLPDDLDSIPFVSKVYKEFLTVEKYGYSTIQHPMLTLNTSRGCASKCTFCVYIEVFSKRIIRRRSAENIVEEMKYIRRELPQIKEVMFEDDTFTQDPRHVEAFCHLMIKEKVKLTWSANARVHVTLDTLKLMKKAGCRLLCVGIENGDQEVLNKTKKGITPETIRKFMVNARKAGILIHGCFMFGLPGETRETMKKTADLAKELNPDSAQFFPVMAYPGTEFYNWAKENGYLTTDKFNEWNTPDGQHSSIVSRPGLSGEDLVNYSHQARKEFYFRPQYLTMKFAQVVRHPRELTRNIRAFMTLKKNL